MESSRGAERATFVPPASLANQILDERQIPDGFFLRSMIFEAAEVEVTRGPGERLTLPEDECDEDVRVEIDATFRRKLGAIRRLPKRDRPAARRAAMDERSSSLQALRQKREAARRFRRFL